MAYDRKIGFDFVITQVGTLAEYFLNAGSQFGYVPLFMPEFIQVQIFSLALGSLKGMVERAVGRFNHQIGIKKQKRFPHGSQDRLIQFRQFRHLGIQARQLHIAIA